MADEIGVVRGKVGTWEYFVGVMTFRQIANNIKYFEEMRPAAGLDALQRQLLQSRARAMVEYLKSKVDRFYGSIVVAVSGGAISKRKVEVVERGEEEPLEAEDFPFYVLRLSRLAKYYAIDGQHRVASIQRLLTDPERPAGIEDEELSVIFVKHEDDERLRRLFTDVNRYAKRPTQGIGLPNVEKDPPGDKLTTRLESVVSKVGKDPVNAWVAKYLVLRIRIS